MTTMSRTLRGNPAGWAALAILAIFVGYADLWRGGTEIASAMLVAGYVVLVPIAIIAYGRSRGGDDGAATVTAPAGAARTSRTSTAPADIEPPPYPWAALVGVVVFALYAITLAPTTAMWDTSEYIAAAKVLGIPHPPGNPLFVLIAHAFAMLPIPVGYGARVNLLAATTSAMSAALWFLVAWRSMQGWNLGRVPRIVSAAAAAWIGATAFTVWNQSVVNEKVYTVAMLFVAIVSWAALRWNDAPVASRKADALLVLVAYLCALGYTNHPAGLLPVPAFGLFVLLRRPATLLRWRVILAAAAFFFVGLTPFLFQPIRAAHHPAINVGTPTACTGTPEFSCTFSGETFDRLMSNVNREQYGGHSVANRQVPFVAQVGMWWHYFKWQWLRDAFNEHSGRQSALALLFLALGLFGGVVHFRRDRASFAYVGPLVFTLTPALIFYLNFKYGWSQAVELGDSVPREVRDRDYFYLWSFATWSIWVGLGVAALWQFAAGAIAREKTPATPSGIPRRAWLLAAPVLLIALIPFVGNMGSAPRRGQTFTAEWARDLLQSVEPYGILITNGDNDSFPVWYAQYVEGIRRDVTVALIPYLQADWYARELVSAPIAAYDGSGLPVYDSIAGSKPTQPIFALTPAELDAIPEAIRVDQPSRFTASGIDITVPPGVVPRSDLLVLQMIRDAFPARPIYFSLGNYAGSLGLGEYVVTQGLAQRLLPERAAGNPRFEAVNGAYVDVERSRHLWNFYRGKEALRNNGPWIDDASVLMPTAYGLAGQLIARALQQRGQEAAADSTMQEAVSTLRAARVMR